MASTMTTGAGDGCACEEGAPAASGAADAGFGDAGLGEADAGCEDIRPVGSRSPTGDGKFGQADLAGSVWE